MVCNNPNKFKEQYAASIFRFWKEELLKNPVVKRACMKVEWAILWEVLVLALEITLFSPLPFLAILTIISLPDCQSFKFMVRAKLNIYHNPIELCWVHYFCEPKHRLSADE